MAIAPGAFSVGWNCRFVVCCCQSHEESFLFLASIPRIELEFNFFVMGVVEKSDGAEVAVEAEIEWGLVDNEIQLLQTLCQTSRPIGKFCNLDQYWQMLWLQSWFNRDQQILPDGLHCWETCHQSQQRSYIKRGLGSPLNNVQSSEAGESKDSVIFCVIFND